MGDAAIGVRLPPCHSCGVREIPPEKSPWPRPRPRPRPPDANSAYDRDWPVIGLETGQKCFYHAEKRRTP